MTRSLLPKWNGHKYSVITAPNVKICFVNVFKIYYVPLQDFIVNTAAWS